MEYQDSPSSHSMQSDGKECVQHLEANSFMDGKCKSIKNTQKKVHYDDSNLTQQNSDARYTKIQQYITECNSSEHLHPYPKKQSEVEQFVIHEGEGEAEAAGEDELSRWYSDPASGASLEQVPAAPTQFDINGIPEPGDREGDMPSGKASGRLDPGGVRHGRQARPRE
eukprot:10966549-Alexandrium_andersonii.AAC.2